MLKIIIAGDFTPAFKNKTNHEKNIEFHADLYPFLKDKDLSIVNLETPITTSQKILKTTGKPIKILPESIEIIKSCYFDVLTLANNHILDYEEDGLTETLRLCNSHNLSTVGVGKNVLNACRPLFIKKNGKRISILNYTESEFSIADKERAGANPLDIISVYRDIIAYKKQCDILILIIHGGHEFYKYPSPRMVKIYRFFAETGASVIVGHHPHIPGGYEIHDGVPIFYSLGNFFMDNLRRDTFAWKKGLILKLEFDNNNSLKFEIIPIINDGTLESLRLMNNSEKEKMLSEIEDISNIINDDKLLQDKWEEFHNKPSIRNSYLRILKKQNRLIYKLIKMGILKNRKMHLKALLGFINTYRCESHRDSMIQILNDELNYYR